MATALRQNLLWEVLVQPIRPDQVRLPTDRVADPIPADVLLNGNAYVPVPVAPNGAETSSVESDYEL